MNAKHEWLRYRYPNGFSQIISKLSTDIQYGKRIVTYSQYVVKSLREILFLNPETDQMRSYSAVNDNRLKVNASNISAVLYGLCNDKIRKKQLMDVLRELPENEIQDIAFETGPLNDVIFFLQERYGTKDEKIDATRLSDGTLRSFAILAAILSNESQSMVVIEEIDNGVHPGRAKKLIRVLSTIAKERSIDVIATTHNAILLNALSKEDLAGVNLIYRSDEGDGSAIPFMDIPNMPILLDAVMPEFNRMIKSSTDLLILPFATIIETETILRILVMEASEDLLEKNSARLYEKQ